MSVVSTLTALYEQTGSKYIKIPSDVFGAGPIQDAIEQILSGQLQIGSAQDNITFTADAAKDKVTIVGVGTLPPVDQITITVVFTGKNGGVEMELTGTVKTDWTLSDAWPSHLDVFPFNDVTITGGTVKIDIQPGAKEVKLTAEVSSKFHDETLAVDAATDGLFVVDFKSGESDPTFAAGFLITGAWSPFTSPGLGLSKDFDSFAAQFELGLFFATLEVDDLSFFDNLKGDGKLFFLPDKISPGLTFLAGFELTNTTTALLTNLFTGKPQLDFTVIKGTGTADLDISAELKDIELGTVTFDEFGLEWKEADMEIDLTAVTSITAPSVNLKNLGICGGGVVKYGDQPSVSFDLVTGKCGDGTEGWVDPFFIKFLTIDDFGFDVGITAEDQVHVDVAGQIEIGEGADAVQITAATGISFDGEFPTPDGVVFDIKGAQKPVTLGNVITDVVKVFDNDSGFPKGTVLDDIVIDEIKLAVTQTPITLPPSPLEFDPFISIRGDITLFGYNLDVMLTFDTNAAPPFLQACGTINHNGGPIVIEAGGFQLLKLSDAGGTKGPAACLDTKALTSTSTFCGGTGDDACKAVTLPSGQTGYFLVLDAAVDVLGLADASVLAYLAKDSFDFDMQWNLFDTVKEKLACTFDPNQGHFFAANDFQFKFPVDISFTIDDIHVTIPFKDIIPSVSFCIALGTYIPEAVCGLPARGPGDPFFHFDFDFSWLGIDFDLAFDLDFKTVESILKDFGQFLVDWLSNPLKWGELLMDLAKHFILKCLYAIGKTFEEAVQALANALGVAFDEIAKLAKDIWSDLEKCAQETADALL